MELARIFFYLILAHFIAGNDYLPKDRFVMLPNHVKSGNSIENLSTSQHHGGDLIADAAGTPTCMGTYFTSQTSYSFNFGDYFCNPGTNYGSCSIVFHMWIYLLDQALGSIMTDVSDSGTKLTSTRTDGDHFYDYHIGTSDYSSLVAGRNKWIRFYRNTYATIDRNVHLITSQDNVGARFSSLRYDTSPSGSMHFGLFSSDSGFNGFIYVIEIFRDLNEMDGSNILDDSNAEFYVYSSGTWSWSQDCGAVPSFDQKCVPETSYCEKECNENGSATCNCFDQSDTVSNDVCWCSGIPTVPSLCYIDPNSFFSNGAYVCKDGYYKDSSLKCITCMDNCDKCTGAGQCTFCTFGYYTTGSSCDKCGCDTCNSLAKCYECATLVIQDESSCRKTSVGYEIAFDSPYIVIDFAYQSSNLIEIAKIEATSSQGTPISTTGWTMEPCTTTQCKIFTDNLSVSQLPIQSVIEFKTA